ncbi:hypothetical protein D3C71_1339410 [compost metagenome]
MRGIAGARSTYEVVSIQFFAGRSQRFQVLGFVLHDGRSATLVRVERTSASNGNENATALHGLCIVAFTKHHGLVVGNCFFDGGAGSDGSNLAAFTTFVVFVGGQGSDLLSIQLRQHRSAGWAVLQHFGVVRENVCLATGGADGVVDVDGFAVGRQEFHLLGQPVTNTKIVRASERVDHADIGCCGRQDNKGFTFVVQCLYVLASGHSAIEFLSLFQSVTGNNDTADSGFHCCLQNGVGITNLRFSIATSVTIENKLELAKML